MGFNELPWLPQLHFTKEILRNSGCSLTFSQLKRIWTDLSNLTEPTTAWKENSWFMKTLMDQWKEQKTLEVSWISLWKGSQFSSSFIQAHMDGSISKKKKLKKPQLILVSLVYEIQMSWDGVLWNLAHHLWNLSFHSLESLSPWESWYIPGVLLKVGCRSFNQILIH